MSKTAVPRTAAASGLALLLAFAAPVQATADEPRAGSLVIEAPWARASAPTAATAAAFLSVRNDGGTPDRLIDVRSPVAERAELHTHASENGIMRMRRVPSVEVPANAMASLAPGGFHVMLFGLKGPLVEGESFPMTLSFETSGTVRITVPVLSAGASAPAAGVTGHAH